MRRFSPSALLVIFAFCLGFASATQAQDQFTRVEVGGQFDGIRLLNAEGRPEFKPGFGAHLDINLTRRLAFESTVDFFPRNAPQTLNQGGQGGRTLQALFGARAKFITARRYSVYGVLRTGLTYETNNLNTLIIEGTDSLFVTARSGPLTHFTLDLGGGIEFYPTRRWIFRAEVDASPYFVGNVPLLNPTILGPSGAPIAQTGAPGTIFTPWKLSLGASYRVGALRDFPRDDKQGDQEDQSGRFSRLTIGAQATSLSLSFVDGVDRATTEVGVGPFASYRIWRFVEADTAMFLFPREEQSNGPHDGGRILQGFYGVRAGFRTRHIGFFAKVRPGFESNSRALTGETVGTSMQVVHTFARATDFALDLGGVVELYPTKHFVIRLDAGDAMIYPGTRTINFNGTLFSTPAVPRRDTMQFGGGFGWRF
jgi:outer membrane protein with beta-barrel domain